MGVFHRRAAADPPAPTGLMMTPTNCIRMAVRKFRRVIYFPMAADAASISGWILRRMQHCTTPRVYDNEADQFFEFRDDPHRRATSTPNYEIDERISYSIRR